MYPIEFQDPNFRLTHFYHIITKEGEKARFTPNIIQQKINSVTALRKMILKARQFGISTSEILKMFDAVMFTRNTTGCILAHKDDAIEKLFRIVRRAYEFMPEEVKPRLDRGGGSKYEMFFPDINSRIYCDLEIRGDTVQWLHVSEAAFMKDSAKLKATLQAVPLATGRVTIETTANGMANHFYDMWTDPDQPYEKLFFPWFIFPDYKMPAPSKMLLSDEEIQFVKKVKKNYGVSITNEQIMFRRFKKAELKFSTHDQIRVSFEQEYPEDEQSCFLASGEAVLDLFKIAQMMKEIPTPIEDNGGIKIYKPVNKTRAYVCGADTAEGISKDFSVGVMVDIDSKEVVAKVRGQWKPGEFAEKLFEFCEMYSSPGGKWPTLAVERNNHGHAVLLKLDEVLGYSNLYVAEQDERLGWKTDKVTRPIMINAFIDAVENGHLRLNDKEILNECLTLVDNDGKIEAASGKNDDCITACAIALQLCINNSSSVYEDIENRIKL